MPSTQSNGTAQGALPIDMPDIEVSVRQVFGIESDMVVPAFSVTPASVPDN